MMKEIGLQELKKHLAVLKLDITKDTLQTIFHRENSIQDGRDRIKDTQAGLKVDI